MSENTQNNNGQEGFENKNAAKDPGAGQPQGGPQAPPPPQWKQGGPDYSNVYGTPPPGQYPYQPYTPKPFLSDKRESLFCLIALSAAFLFSWLVLFGGLGVGIAAFVPVVYLAAVLYGIGLPQFSLARSFVLFIPVGLLSSCFVLYNNPTLKFFNVVLLIILLIFHLKSMFDARLYKPLSNMFAVEFLQGFFEYPLMNLDKIFRTAGKSGKPERKGIIRRVLLGFVCGLPLIFIICALLASADPAFEEFIRNILAHITVWEIVKYSFTTFVLAIPFFSLFYSLRYNRPEKKKKEAVLDDRRRIVDTVAVNTVLILLLIMYVIFLALQFNYLFSAMQNRLPDSFNYSEYARRGFFELLVVAAINFVFFIFTYVLAKRREGRINPVSRVLLMLLSVSTLVLIGSAFSKMYLYMKDCGLTLLRVFTSWFMILLFVVFIALIVKLITKKFPATAFISVFFVVFYLALNFANVDKQIAAYNVKWYQNHTETNAADMIGAFSPLSDSMIPEIEKLLNSDDPEVVAEVRKFMGYRAVSTFNRDYAYGWDDWQSYSVASAESRKVLTRLFGENPQYSDFDPDYYDYSYEVPSSKFE